MADEEEPEDDPEPEIPEDAQDANDAGTPAKPQSPTVSKSLSAGSGVEKSEKSRLSTRSGIRSDRTVTSPSTIENEGIVEPLEGMLTKSQEELSKFEDISLDEKKASLNELSKDRLRKSKKMYRQCHRRFREIIGKRELKNEELEKQTGDLKQRLNILECSMPAVMVWNIWRMTQGASVPSLKRILEKQFQGPASGEVYCPSTPSRHFDCRVREVEAERKQALKRAEEARSLWAEKVAALEDKDKRLEEAKRIQEETKEKIEQLTAEAKKLKAAAAKDAEDGACETGECGVIECKKKWLDKVPSNASIRTTDIDCLQRLQELAEKELAMKRQMADMERREEAYMRTLQQADELWSKLEGDAASTVSVLQEQLDLKTTANQKMANRICELEDVIEQLMARLSNCRGELEKYVSVTKIEALIGRDDDFANILDKEVSAFADQEERMVGTDGYVGGVRHRGVLVKGDMAEKDVMAIAEMGDAQIGIHPDDFDHEERRLEESGDERLIGAADYLGQLGPADNVDYEERRENALRLLEESGDERLIGAADYLGQLGPADNVDYEERRENALRLLEESGDERLKEAAEYLAQLGSLSELDQYGDDFVCDITCNDQVLTESGLTEEEIKALEENRVTARALMEKTGMDMSEELAKVRAILEPAETVVKTEIFDEDAVERHEEHVDVTIRTVEDEEETIRPREVEAAKEIGVGEEVVAELVAIAEERTVPAEGAEEDVVPAEGPEEDRVPAEGPEEVVATEDIAVPKEVAQEIAPAEDGVVLDEPAVEVPPAIAVTPVDGVSIPEEVAEEVARDIVATHVEEVAVSMEAAEEVAPAIVATPVEGVAVPKDAAEEMGAAIGTISAEEAAEKVPAEEAAEKVAAEEAAEKVAAEEAAEKVPAEEAAGKVSAEEAAEKVATPEKAAEKVAAPKEAAEKVADPEEAAEKVAAPKEAAEKVAAPEEAAEKVAAPEEAAEKVAAPEEAAEKVAAPEEAAEKVAAPEEAAEKVAAPEEAAEKVAAPEEAAEKVAAPKEAAEKVAAPEEAAEKVAAPEEAAEKVAAPEEAAEKVAAPKEAAEKVAAPEEAGEKVAAPEQVPPAKEVVVAEEVAPATHIAEKEIPVVPSALPEEADLVVPEEIAIVAEQPEVPSGVALTEITDVATEPGAIVADERNILVSRDQMFSWKDDVDLIRSTIAQCSNCVIVKKDADDLARQLAIFTGVEVKGIDGKPKPTGEAPAGTEEVVPVEGQAAHADVARVPTELAETVSAEGPVAEDVQKADELTVTNIEATEAAPGGEEIELQVQQIEEAEKEAIDIEDKKKELEVVEIKEAEGEPVSAEAEEPDVAEEAIGEDLLAPEEQATEEKSGAEEDEVLTVEVELEEEVVSIDVELIPEEIESEKLDDKLIDGEETSEPCLPKESEESSLEEEPVVIPCTCELPVLLKKEPLKKLEITQTEITRIETVQVITQTAEDIGTQTLPSPTVLRQILSPKIITTTETLQADSQIINKIMHSRMLHPDQVTATSITESSQRLMTSSIQMRTMDAPLSNIRRYGEGPRPGPEQEIRSFHYGKKSGEVKEGKCDCCQCGKTVPNTCQATKTKVESRESAALLKFISTLPSLKKPHGLSVDQTAQHEAVCPHCRIKKLEGAVKTHEVSGKPPKKSTQDQQICACDPPLLKYQTSQKTKQRSDQSCMAKIPKATKSERVPKKSLDRDTTNQQADQCPCTADIETGIPGIVKKVRCACAEFD